MDIFLHLFLNIIPLYLIIALGWYAGRYFAVDLKTLGALCIFLFVPIVSFGFIVQVELQAIYMALPVIVWALLTVFTLVFYRAAKMVYPDSRANLLAMCAATGNLGYFGLPLALLLFETQWVGVYMFMLIGGILYEGTVMYYIANRGKFSVRESVIRLIKFPTLYAAIAALFVNVQGIELPALFFTYWAYFKGAYVVIGMMIIGVALSKVTHFLAAPRFMALTMAGKFVVWPVVTYLLIMVDAHVFRFFAPEVHQMLFMMAIMPPAANVTAFAAQLDMNPEKAATTVFVCTVLALLYVPAMLVLSGLY